MDNLIILIDPDDQQLAEEAFKDAGPEVHIVSEEHFNADGPLVKIIVPLAVAALPFFLNCIKDFIKRKKDEKNDKSRPHDEQKSGMTVKCGDLEISNVAVENLEAAVKSIQTAKREANPLTQA